MRFISTLIWTVCLSLSIHAQSITTVAGNSSWGAVYNVGLDSAGNIYVADPAKHQVYKVDPFGATVVIAGTGRAGFSGDGALATAAQLNAPQGAAVGPDGSVYITDYSNDRIRKIAPNGIMTTIAGSVGGFTGDGGPATAARLNGPISIVVDPAGNIYFSDFLNFRIRKIATTGVISTVAGTGRFSLSGDGGPATAADSLPCWIALGPDGSLYFSDDGDARLNGNKRVRRVAPNGIISTVAGTGVSGFTGDGGPATQAQLRSVSGVAVDAGGNIFISDAESVRIRKVDPSGKIITYAGNGTAGATGDGGVALSAQLNFPSGMAVDSVGNLYFTDTRNFKVRKISIPPAPAVRTDNPVLTSFGGKAGFSSNTYVEVYGQNFSSTQRLWGGADFSGSNAPTSLDGVSVTVNGRPAYVYYISPNQININTPEDTAIGPVTIQVRAPLGMSNSVVVNRARLSPTLQTVSQFLIDGKQYAVALTPDFSTFIGRPGMLPGVSFTLARPGDTIAIYALGCGPTSPPTQAGVVAAQASALSLPYRLRIGGQAANVTFAGMVGGTIGLYQFNAVVPNVAAGDQPIDLEIDGVSNGQNLVISIGQ
ncbi:MAG: IPT/TIG domain-containing protein [Bryobacteraceae bacterium]